MGAPWKFGDSFFGKKAPFSGSNSFQGVMVLPFFSPPLWMLGLFWCEDCPGKFERHCFGFDPRLGVFLSTKNCVLTTQVELPMGPCFGNWEGNLLRWLRVLLPSLKFFAREFTNLKNGGWKIPFLWGYHLFRCYVSFRESKVF